MFLFSLVALKISISNQFTARTSEVMMKEGQHACVVCSDLANGVHFGAVTCEGCKVVSVFDLNNALKIMY